MSINFFSALQSKLGSYGSRAALLESKFKVTYTELILKVDDTLPLLEKYINTNKAIGFLGHPGIEFIIYLLAVLKLGGIYVPIPLDQSLTNQKRILKEVPGIIVISFNRDSLAKHLGASLFFSVKQSKWFSLNHERKKSISLPKDTLYIAFSSGSTNTPKGILGSGSGLWNRLSWYDKAFPFQKREVLCQKTSLAFIDHLAEIFQPLFSGQPLKFINSQTVRDLQAFANFLHKEKITRLTTIPSYLNLLVQLSKQQHNLFSSLKMIVSSGEPLSLKLCAEFKENLPHIRLINFYGSSEVTADVSCFEYTKNLALKKSVTDNYDSYSTLTTPSSSPFLPIGHPIANCKVRIMSEDETTCPIGEVGEIVIEGKAVFLGYLDHYKLKISNSIPSCFKTGDLGKANPLGYLEYVGRKNRLVKFNGMRVHLTELEQFFRELLSVTDCALIIWESTSISQLVLFYESSISKIESKYIHPNKIQKLGLKIYPTKIVQLDKLPKLPSGKIDYQTLIQYLKNKKNIINKQVCNKNTLEKSYNQIFLDFLSSKKMDMNANFFDLGFDSITINLLMLTLNRTLNLNLILLDLFHFPTPKKLLDYAKQKNKNNTKSSLQKKRLSYFRARKRATHQISTESPTEGI